VVLIKQGSSGGSSGHYLLGLKILVLLVGEMNQPIGGRTLTSHRKAAISFRDTRLFSVFQLALTALRQLAAAPQPDTKLQDQVRQSVALFISSLRCSEVSALRSHTLYRT
jgi:hypothetical protein